VLVRSDSCQGCVQWRNCGACQVVVFVVGALTQLESCSTRSTGDDRSETFNVGVVLDELGCWLMPRLRAFNSEAFMPKTQTTARVGLRVDKDLPWSTVLGNCTR
jgi:hypothetical protein